MRSIGYYENLTRGSDEFPVEFYYIDSTHPRYEMDLHWHGEVEIVYIEKGSFDLQLNGKQYTLSPGDVVYINENILHSGIPHNCTYYCVVFSEKKMFKNAPALFAEATDFDCCILHSDRHAIRYISAAIVESKRMVKGDIFRIYSNLFALYSELSHAEKLEVALNERGGKNMDALKNAIEIIETEYKNEISLKTLADACNMTPEYFCSFFKRFTGRTPFEYLNSYRIEIACETLVYKGLSVTETAFLCGFNDLSYFIKTFKRLKNISPGKYAEFHRHKN